MHNNTLYPELGGKKTPKPLDRQAEETSGRTRRRDPSPCGTGRRAIDMLSTEQNNMTGIIVSGHKNIRMESRNQTEIQVRTPVHSVFCWEGQMKLIMIPDKRSHLHRIAGRCQNHHAHINSWLRDEDQRRE